MNVNIISIYYSILIHHHPWYATTTGNQTVVPHQVLTAGPYSKAACKLKFCLKQVTYIFICESSKLFTVSLRRRIFSSASRLSWWYSLLWNYGSHRSENNINQNLHASSQWHRFYYTASSKFVCFCLIDSFLWSSLIHLMILGKSHTLHSVAVQKT
jgi:hypothetical protein